MRTTLYLAAGLSVAVAALSATAPAGAAGATGARHTRATPEGLVAFKVVANNLNNPRQLDFAKSGKLYIAEAGTGGTADCTVGGEGGIVCWGASGSVTVVANGHQHRLIDGLPSYADQGAGTSALGPADVVPYGHGKLAISLGYGLKPKQRDSLADPGNRFATIISANLKKHKLSQVADLAAFEQKHNPVADRNTDPTGLFKWGKAWYAADSGANDVLKVAKGKTKLVAAFQNQKTSQGKVQAVPTDVAVGPDGALYVSELTGFPFVKGAAKIFRIVPGHKPTVYANHLTNVTSIAFGKDGKLYAVQIANDGLQSGPTGSLWRVASKKSGKKSKNLTGDLFAPYGVAIKGKSAYVSTGAVAPGAGQVIKVPLS